MKWAPISFNLPFERENLFGGSSFQSDKRLPLLLFVVLGSSSQPSSFAFLLAFPPLRPFKQSKYCLLLKFVFVCFSFTLFQLFILFSYVYWNRFSWIDKWDKYLPLLVFAGFGSSSHPSSLLVVLALLLPDQPPNSWENYVKCLDNSINNLYWKSNMHPKNTINKTQNWQKIVHMNQQVYLRLPWFRLLVGFCGAASSSHSSLLLVYFFVFIETAGFVAGTFTKKIETFKLKY